MEQDSISSSTPLKPPSLPPDRRHYIKADEVVSYKAKNFVVYTGRDKGLYVDANIAWMQEHTKDNEATPTTHAGKDIENMHHVPDHKPDVALYTDGEYHSVDTKPIDSEGTPLKIQRDSTGNKIYKARHSARVLNGSSGIPRGATDVYISSDRHQPVQALYTSMAGKRTAIYTPEAKAEGVRIKWEEHRKAIQPLRKAISSLKKMNVEDMSDAEKVLSLVSTMGFRHGQTGEARTHADRSPTGVGALSLVRNNVTVEGQKTTFTFRGKHDREQHHVSKNPRIAEIMNSVMEGKGPTDRLFNTSEDINNRTLVKLAGKDSPAIHVRALRTLKAGDKVREMLKTTPMPTNKREFEKTRNTIGLAVAKMLGHKKADGTVHAGEAIASYIDPQLWDSIDPSKRELQKAYVPDWHGKGPNEERDIDEWAEDRTRKGEKRQWGLKGLPGRPPKGVDKRIIKAPKTWIEQIMEQGFMAPMIKQVTPNGQQMWFTENGIDYVADLGPHVYVQKAVFKPTLRQPSISYAPSQSNRDRKQRRNVQGEPYTGDVIDDDDERGGL